MHFFFYLLISINLDLYSLIYAGIQKNGIRIYTFLMVFKKSRECLAKLKLRFNISVSIFLRFSRTDFFKTIRIIGTCRSNSAFQMESSLPMASSPIENNCHPLICVLFEAFKFLSSYCLNEITKTKQSLSTSI